MKNVEFLCTATHTETFNIIIEANKNYCCTFLSLKTSIQCTRLHLKMALAVFFSQPDYSIVANHHKTEVPMNVRPVTYATKSFSACEEHYANIGMELLSMVFGVKMFKHFVFGCKCKVITDH